MRDYIPVISAVVAGVFAMMAAVIAWRLKTWSEAREGFLARAKERHDELKLLYTDVFVLLEQAIRQILQDEEFTLDRELSAVNARVNLLASPGVIDQYHAVSQLLTKWTQLHYKSRPRKIKIGEHTATILQAPDPTAQYKKPASEAYEELQTVVEQLVKLMRAELNGDA